MIGVIILVVLLLAGALFVFRGSVSKTNDLPQDQSEAPIPILSPEDVGMVVTVRQDKRALMFELKKAQDIKHVDYEIQYTHDVEGQEVQEGLLGEMNIAKDGITKTDYRPFGTCSAVCRYDVGVSDVVIILKVEKKDGRIYQVQKSVEL